MPVKSRGPNWPVVGDKVRTLHSASADGHLPAGMSWHQQNAHLSFADHGWCARHQIGAAIGQSAGCAQKRSVRSSMLGVQTLNNAPTHCRRCNRLHRQCHRGCLVCTEPQNALEGCARQLYRATLFPRLATLCGVWLTTPSGKGGKMVLAVTLLLLWRHITTGHQLESHRVGPRLQHERQRFLRHMPQPGVCNISMAGDWSLRHPSRTSCTATRCSLCRHSAPSASLKTKLSRRIQSLPEHSDSVGGVC